MSIASSLHTTSVSLSTPRANLDKSIKLRGVDPATTARDYSREECEFLKAVDAYRTKHNRPYLSMTEAFRIMTQELGYHKMGLSS